MTAIVHLSPRDFAAGSVIPPGVTLSLVSFTKSIVGGCEAAVLRAEGPLAALESLCNLLRSPVLVTDELDAPLWWGFLSSVTFPAGIFRYSIGLDAMYNAIAVQYAGAAIGDLPGVTDYALHADSIAEYGRREWIAPHDNSGRSQADQYRNVLMGLHQLPVASLQITSSSGFVASRGVALLVCSGWWSTLNWLHYEQLGDWQVYIDEGIFALAWGDVAARTMVAQSFTAALAWSVHEIRLHMLKVGTPTDDLTLTLCANTAGAPGAVLATATVHAADISAFGGWVAFELAADYALVAGTVYWLHLERAGAVDPVNYYTLSATEVNGGAGDLRFMTGAAWVARVPDADAMYMLVGQQAIEKQLSDTILADVNHFLTSVDYDFASGVSCSAYRDKFTLAGDSCDKLLQVGESTDDLQLVATVEPSRRVRLSILPAKGAADWTVNQFGKLRDMNGLNTPPSRCPVGVWVRPVDTLAGSLDASRLADMGAFLVERAAYSAASNEWRPAFRSLHAEPVDITFIGDDQVGWERTRQLVLARDGYKCVRCGRTEVETGSPLEVHHIVPRSVGGGDNPLNLVTLCQPCHIETSTYGDSEVWG